jgi:PRTRC genetic system protein B
MYVEYFDMDEDGSPINAHPLTTNEAKYLAKRLKIQNCREKEFLKPQGIISSNILLIDNSENAKVIWYTEFSERELYFSKDLEIPNGTAKVPSLIWCADKLHLKIFAVDYNQRPTEETSLYHAPFFNIYDNGSVCMGTLILKLKSQLPWKNLRLLGSIFFQFLFQSLNVQS